MDLMDPVALGRLSLRALLLVGGALLIGSGVVKVRSRSRPVAGMGLAPLELVAGGVLVALAFLSTPTGASTRWVRPARTTADLSPKGWSWETRSGVPGTTPAFRSPAARHWVRRR